MNRNVLKVIYLIGVITCGITYVNAGVFDLVKPQLPVLYEAGIVDVDIALTLGFGIIYSIVMGGFSLFIVFIFVGICNVFNTTNNFMYKFLMPHQNIETKSKYEDWEEYYKRMVEKCREMQKSDN